MSEAKEPILAPSSGRYRRGLLGLLVFGALSQGLIQHEAFTVNPMVLVPQVDAAVLWDRAGEMAAGAWIDDAPFETAPLYLWFLALIRSAGMGLIGLGVVQSVMHLGTALLVARIGRGLVKRIPAFGAGTGSDRSVGARWAENAGLMAGALFLLLDEPAATTSRVLGGTLQLLLVTLLADQALRRPADGGSTGWSLRIGALSGVLALAFPPFLIAWPILALWIFLSGGRRPAAAAAALVAGALVIAPATLHNVKASGEWIPISSQSGLTFYHGNNPSADGTLAAVGVVNSKADQAEDSLRQAREVLGPDAGWKDASQFWMSKGLKWWAEEPGTALGVAFRKLWYTASARRYGDIYQPWMERRDGVATRLWLAPIPLSWVLPVGFVTLIMLMVRGARVRLLPVALLVAVPLAVCVVFWYTPRYRMPVAPLITALGAAGFVAALGVGGRRLVVLGAALAFGVASGFLNDAIEFETNPIHERRHAARMAAASGALGRHDDGMRYLRADLALAPEDPEARSRVVNLAFALGRDADAVECLRASPPAVLAIPGPRMILAWTLATSSDPSVHDAEESLALADALVTELRGAPDALDTRAAARARGGDHAGALVDAEAAIAALSAGDPLRAEIEERAALYRRGEAYTQPQRNGEGL